jgi:hypothetical protein
MIKMFCDGCGAEMPKPGSKKTIIDITETKFSIDGQARQTNASFCEDCTDKISTLLKTLKPIKL